MIQSLVKKVFGSRSDREVKQLYPLVNEINKFADKLLDKSDEELKARSIELRTEIISAVEEAKQTAKKEIDDKDEAIKSILLGVLAIKSGDI
jgi:preprotein translocase subunit SecA